MSSDIVELLSFLKLSNKPTEWVLATVIETKGSVPQKLGASMLVNAAGKIVGTVGGGLMEAKCIEACRLSLRQGACALFSFEMRDKYHLDAGPICGGTVSIFLNPNIGRQLTPINKALSFFDNNESFYISWPKDPAMDSSGALMVQREEIAHPGNVTIAIPVAKKLWVFGAGHCGCAIADLGAWLGFETHLVDERLPVSVTDLKSNRSIQIHQSSAQDFIGLHKTSCGTAIVLVHKGHKEDALALRQVVGSNAGYVGMIGSKRKVKMMRRYFIENKWATDMEWQKIHAPIGLELGGNEVRDIALSVLAQITQVFNKQSLNSEKRATHPPYAITSP